MDGNRGNSFSGDIEEDDDFSISEDMDEDLGKMQEYVDHCLENIRYNYVKLRAVFLKLYKLRMKLEHLDLDKRILDDLILYVYDVSTNFMSPSTIEKANLDAMEVVQNSKKH